MRVIRKFAPLIVTVGLVLGVGTAALVTSAGANRKSETVHRDDRAFLQNTLAGLANQYVLFALKEAYDFAGSRAWTFEKNDPGDRTQLQQFVTRSALLNHGAALSDLSANELNRWAKKPGLPDATDPGYQPLISGLLAQQPGLSAVMHVDGVPVVALAVPIMDGSNQPRAIFLAYFNARTSPLETYNQQLKYGETGSSYLIDSRGGIIAATEPERVGQRFTSKPVLDLLARGKKGFVEYELDGEPMVAAYGSIGVGGWASLSEQTASEFYGPIRSGGFRVRLALLAMLIVAAAALVALNHKRQLALKKAYDYKGELLANTTHELKTPLTAIRGAAMTLGVRWRDMPPEQVESFLGIIHRRCDGLGKLIERILMGARLEAGREIVVHPTPLEVTGTLRRISADFEDGTSRHPIRVTSAADVWVSADPDAVDQILGLLVENAIKYSPDGGEVRLEARREGAVVEFRVSDQGIGIGPGDMAHVFEPYYKASRGDVQRFAGVGLGLSIARHLVKRHDGEMRVESEQGVGSTFIFTLPACDPPEDAVRVDLVSNAG